MPQINLLGNVKKKKRSVGINYPGSVLFPILLIIVYGVCFFVFLIKPLSKETVPKRQRLLAMDEKMSNLPEGMRNDNTSIPTLQARIRSGEQQLSFIADVKSRRYNAMLVLTAVHNNIPKEMWIDSLDFVNNAAELKGRSSSSEAVFEFNKILDSQAEFRNSQVVSVGAASAGNHIVEYIIRIEVKNIFDV